MFNKPLLLVIDDLKSNRMIIKKILRNSFDFIEASDGVEALKLLNSYKPDIILIDAIMPNLDGFETIKKIREINIFKTTPILMITSLTDIKIKIKALENGVNDFLTKPFDKYELRARCNSYMNMVKLHKQYNNTQLNPITRYKNKHALLKELLPSDGIFLFSINEFYKIAGLYGYKNSTNIEIEYGKILQKLVEKYLEKAQIYHISIGKFVLKTKSNKSYTQDELQNLCETFYNILKNSSIETETITYQPISTIVYAKDRLNLYEDAMSAMSYAKKHSIKYIYCSDDINGIKDIVYSNIEMIKKAKQAVNEKNIINFYQPIFDNEQEKITKYETLVRMKDKNGQIITPNIFLEAVKNTKIYEEITKTVYKNAFDTFKFHNEEFSINISYIDIENKSVKEYIFDILKNNPHVSHKIIFELQDDKNIKDFGLIKEFINEVKKYEAKIAIDDFGGDNSTIKNLIEIKPDLLKIDSSIVKNIIHDSKSYTLLESINELAHSLDIKTVAEHISTKELLNEIRNIGIDYSQGYYISKPLTQKDIEDIKLAIL